MTSRSNGKRVVIVTGGGAGIGAAIATELGRCGDHVVTVDPLVAVDGTAAPTDSAPTTAERITTLGGSAEASNTSVTDASAMQTLVTDLVDRYGRLDAVVNAAGISRPTGFAKGKEADWAAVIDVHLHGYLNVLTAVMPHFARVGAGHVVGVTSGSGWRSADAGAYGCAKRAVASLTWKLGRVAPDGVHVNAISPIAMTRMVTSALKRNTTQPTSGSRVSGGLALGALPPPEHLGPLGAAMAGHVPTPRGRILFAGGSEVALLREPQLIETIRTAGTSSVESVVQSFLPTLIAAEKQQSTTGGANARFGEIFSAPLADAESPTGLNVLIVSDRLDLATSLTKRFTHSGCNVMTVTPDQAGAGFDGAKSLLQNAFAGDIVNLVIIALAGTVIDDADENWQSVIGAHSEFGAEIIADARWARAVADYAIEHQTNLRIVNVIDARNQRGSTRGQTVAQLFRAARGATQDLVSAFAIAEESANNHEATVALSHACAKMAESSELSGAELVVGDGWIGLRSHPSPAGSMVFGGPELPVWFASVLGEMSR